VDRFEVDLRYGAFVLRQSDLFVNDVFDVPLTRSYSSRDWIDVDRPHSFGRNTNHPYDIEPLGSRRPYTYMELVLEDGDTLHFRRISSGEGFEDAVYMHTETSTRFYKAIISWNGDGWTLRLADGGEMRFPEAYNSKTVAQGAADRVVDSTGHELRLVRDQQRNLREIVTPHRRRIHFTYDDQDRIIRAEDDRGNSVRYDYNSDGMLASVISSSGTTRRYEYDGALMTSILDEHGSTLLINTYSSGNLIAQQYANGDVYRYSYHFDPNATCMKGVVVTLPDHTQRTIYLADSVHTE
jgi:YD repeat-containing protein